MSRRSSPLLTRRIIADTALRMMDRDGYAAFSLPRLGDELGVRTPSLYHHFRDRADILAEVARTVVLRAELPQHRPGDPWTEYFVRLSVNFRRTILRHHNAAPVLLEFLPRDVLLARYEIATAQLAHHAEVPASQYPVVMDGLEKLTLGSALVEASGPGVRSDEPDSEQLFVGTVQAFLAGVVTLGEPGPPPIPTTTGAHEDHRLSVATG